MQSAHGLAEFAYTYPTHFNDWMRDSKYLVSLSVDNEENLKELFSELTSNGAIIVAFNEPDINDQLTSICFYGTPEIRKLTEHLDLALKN